MAHLQGRAGERLHVGFQLRDHAAAVVAERARLVEFGPEPFRHIAAVAGERGQRLAEAPFEIGEQVGERGRRQERSQR